MRIATWNIERLKHKKDLDSIQLHCHATTADILILTETDTCLELHYPYVYYSGNLSGNEKVSYRSTERRIAIYSKTPAVKIYDTYDNKTSVCAEFETNRGTVVVYGTIMGVYGNRADSFLSDVKKQMEDVQELFNTGKQILVCGDYNLSFSDNYYHTNDGRKEVRENFAKCDMVILTEELTEAVDHIAASTELIKLTLPGTFYLLDDDTQDVKIADKPVVKEKRKGQRRNIIKFTFTFVLIRFIILARKEVEP